MTMTHAERAERRLQISKYASLYGVAATVRKFSLSMETVRVACREHGIPFPRLRREAGPHSFEILKALLDGVPLMKIADDFGLTKQRVNQVKQQGIKAGFILKNR